MGRRTDEAAAGKVAPCTGYGRRSSHRAKRKRSGVFCQRGFRGIFYAQGSTAAKGKNLETVKDVLRFFGSEEGQRIQGESGAAIPAYNGLEETWGSNFDRYSYRLDVEKCFDQFEYSVQYINNNTRRKWRAAISDEMVRIYNGSDINESLAKMKQAADSCIPEE